MNICSICSVPAQIPYLGKFWFLRYGPKCSQPIRLQSTISLEQICEIAWFFACWYKFNQIKSWLQNFWMGVVKNGCSQSGHDTLKLTVSQEWIDGMIWFFTCWYKFRKAKSYFTDFSVSLVKNGHGHLLYETLKSAEWVYELNWIFVYWLWCNNFWLDKRTLYHRLLNTSLLQLYLLDQQQWPEGPYEIGSLHLFFLRSVWMFP